MVMVMVMDMVRMSPHLLPLLEVEEGRLPAAVGQLESGVLEALRVERAVLGDDADGAQVGGQCRARLAHAPAHGEGLGEGSRRGWVRAVDAVLASRARMHAALKWIGRV